MGCLLLKTVPGSTPDATNQPTDQGELVRFEIGLGPWACGGRSQVLTFDRRAPVQQRGQHHHRGPGPRQGAVSLADVTLPAHCQLPTAQSAWLSWPCALTLLLIEVPGGGVCRSLLWSSIA